MLCHTWLLLLVLSPLLIASLFLCSARHLLITLRLCSFIEGGELRGKVVLCSARRLFFAVVLVLFLGPYSMLGVTSNESPRPNGGRPVLRTASLRLP